MSYTKSFAIFGLFGGLAQAFFGRYSPWEDTFTRRAATVLVAVAVLSLIGLTWDLFAAGCRRLRSAQSDRRGSKGKLPGCG